MCVPRSLSHNLLVSECLGPQQIKEEKEENTFTHMNNSKRDSTIILIVWKYSLIAL